jgi:hypothetical protein
MNTENIHKYLQQQNQAKYQQMHKIMAENFGGNFRRKLWQKTLAENFCGKLWRKTLAPHKFRWVYRI